MKKIRRKEKKKRKEERKKKREEKKRRKKKRKKKKRKKKRNKKRRGFEKKDTYRSGKSLFETEKKRNLAVKKTRHALSDYKHLSHG